MSCVLRSGPILPSLYTFAAGLPALDEAEPLQTKATATGRRTLASHRGPLRSPGPEGCLQIIVRDAFRLGRA